MQKLIPVCKQVIGLAVPQTLANVSVAVMHFYILADTDDVGAQTKNVAPETVE